MKLKLGFMSNAELNKWFESKGDEKQFAKKKSRWLAKLAEYCDFAPVRGGVEITEIRKYFYVKNKSYQIVRDEFCETWDESGLDSCRRVADEIYSKHADELTVKQSTTYEHTRQVRNELYGKPMIGRGENGTCEYIWCKRENGKLVFLSPEEEELKKKLLLKYFSTSSEKTVMV